MNKIYRVMLLLVVGLTCNSIAKAQVKEDAELFQALKKADELLFNEGFNKCNMQAVEKIMDSDLEFYHDKGGVQNRADFFKAIKDNICSSPDRKPIRKLVEGSLKVYPLTENGELYGAIQQGRHQFYIKEPGKELYLTNIASFTHVFILEKGEWKIKRILSYDHQEPSEYILSYQMDQATNANFPEKLFDKDARIEDLLKQHNITSLAIGVIENGVLSQIRAYGTQQENKPIRTNSIYNVASLTKPVTALVALKLINQGKLDLDELVYKTYVDEDIKDAPELKKLTIRHILSHQTGFPNWRYQNKSHKLTFQFEPGTQYQYSGEGFEYLRKVMEKKFDKPLELLAKELIFDPLDMKDSHFYWTAEVDENRYALEHDKQGNAIPLEKYTYVNAADNLLTTVEDYGKFMVHIMKGAGLSKELYSEMIKSQISVKKDVDFGLGWQIYRNLGAGEFALQHTGEDKGVSSIAIMLPNSKRGLVILSNSENAKKIWRKLIEEYLGDVGVVLIYKNIM